jgi:hypothetical protein
MSARSILFVACVIPGLVACAAGSALATAPASPLQPSAQTGTTCVPGDAECQRIQVADFVCQTSAQCRRFNSPGKTYVCHRSPKNPADKRKFCFLS